MTIKSATIAAALAIAAAWTESSNAQLVSITEENATEVAATIWSLNRAPTVEAFLGDSLEFSEQLRSLVSYAAPGCFSTWSTE